MIITSRKGLFYFQNNESILLKDIQCFGICNFPNDIYLVFHFLGEIGKDTKQGKITRFVIRGDKIIEENEIIKDLDNGVHEITSTGKDIIILQTYYQNIIRYQLDDKYYPILSSKEIITIERFPPCLNIKYLNEEIHKYDDFLNTERYYQHFNSITIQDNFIYLLAPHLKNIRINGENTQNEKLSTIFVFDIHFQYLYEIPLPDYFCHSLVIQGPKIYYLTAHSELRYYDFRDKQTHTLIQYPKNTSKKRNITRGLSITNECIYFGSTYEDKEKNVIVCYKNDTIIEYDSPSNTNICMITSEHFGKDYNHIVGPYKKPFVLQYAIKDTLLSEYINDIISIQEVIDRNNISTTIKKKKSFQNIYKQPPFLEVLNDILYPNDNIFEDVLKNQRMKNPEESLIKLYNHDSFRCDKIHEVLKSMEKKGFNITGSFFLYKPNTGLGWHTNLNLNDNYSFRLYMIFTKSNDSWFLYKHPLSKQIHFIKDRSEYCNLFHLGYMGSPLWHSVLNRGDRNRLSIGLGVDINELKYLRLDGFQDIIH